LAGGCWKGTILGAGFFGYSGNWFQEKPKLFVMPLFVDPKKNCGRYFTLECITGGSGKYLLSSI